MTLLRQPPPLDDYRDVDQSLFHQRLTVADIMTHRTKFRSALSTETVQRAFVGVPPVFDALPVIEGNDRTSLTAGFIGILNRHKADPSRRVRDVMQPLKPIASDCSLIDFISSIEREKLTLVHQAGAEAIIGLVTIHDLARLPARLVVFALLLEVEQTCGEVIERFAGDNGEQWAQLLSDRPRTIGKKSPREEFERTLDYANGVEGSGDVLSELSLGQKLDLLRGLKVTVNGRPLKIPSLLKKLRNTIAHGKPFRHREEHSRSLLGIYDVPIAVKEVLTFRAELKGKLGAPQ